MRNYAFTLPNRDKLVALWANGAAVEEDFGLESTLTISNISAENVIRIDVLHGFEQELVTEIIDGDLVVRDLLVKDYPIIIKFINTTT